jgi:hypothetical protein
VFDGPGVEGETLLGPEALQAVPPERFGEARLEHVPCLRLLAFRFPVHAYYTGARRGEPVEMPAPEPERLALLRRDFVVRRYPLSEPQHALLHELMAGRTVGESVAAAAVLSGLDDAALAGALRGWFRFWAAEGFFRAVSLSDGAG